MRHRLYENNTTFQAEMARLNPGQRAAVEQIDGPVMVLAGPGTGKTHLLAARIGNILLETDTGAHNILCLTFTEAGVKAMRERLLGMIGPEAHRVNISTFHGFCSNVIQQNLQYFGRPGLEPLSELEQIRVIRTLLDELPADNPLKRGYNEPYFHEPYLSHLFGAIKSENWELDQIEQDIDKYLRELPAKEGFFYKRKYKQFAAGDPKPGTIQEETLRMERLRAGARLFPSYQEELRRTRRYDYGDMIGWVLRAFNEHPSLLLTYQERYQYLLVDEFQDTNGSQDNIITLLTKPWERPNIFIVGDDDQAIYEFQGARLRSMVEFFSRYDEVKVVTLRENYRSRQAILDAASTLIRGNEYRIGNELPELEVNKELNAATFTKIEADPISSVPLPADPASVPYSVGTPLKILQYTNQTQELAGLLEQLLKWQDAGVPWEEIAVIYATHAQGKRLRHLLERSGIPYRSKRRPNVLDGRPVRQTRELLAYLDAEHTSPGASEHLIYRILHFRCFGIAAIDLARMNLARTSRLSTGIAGASREQSERGYSPSWRMYLQMPKNWPADLDTSEKVMHVGAWLETMIGQVGSLPLPELVETAMNDSGLLPDTVRDPNRAELVQHLATFSDFVIAEVARRPKLRLFGLLDTLQQMDDNRLELPIRSHLDQAEAILLVTAHSAKGLEFDKVWMLDCAENKWGTGGGGRKSQFKLPDTLSFTGPKSEEEARRRLFFVAITRAKTEVIMSVADIDDKGRAQERAVFLDELVAGTDLEIEAGGLASEEIARLAEVQLQPVDKTTLPGLEAAAITELLKDFRLSVSALYAYLDCPTRFFYEKLLRVPDREREKTLYGSVLHEALETYFNRMLSDSARIFPSKEELLFNFEDSLGLRRGLFKPGAFAARLEQGRKELSQYYDTYRSTWTDDCEIELTIRNAEVDGIPLTGKIDRVDILSDAYVRVVDYKTSASGSGSKGKLRAPTKSKPEGGDYWRQLAFYKLLYDNRPGQIRRVKSGAISYLLVNQAGEQPFAELALQPKDMDALRKILKDVWERIQEQDFVGCGECEWCRFVAELRVGVPVGLGDFGLDDVS
ncbi:ATP-dependent helicase [Neolewinella antarctica]|uniref:DNA 3'-5' helicase n=1 Tax=Neolewinella antarctica TaxID=442734 RepID=A0ABX0XE50_9BACT|nr:ATP-dependent DNA helicase [Neolewinella antarctica]NJC27492.1 DNA helicase-2/ATP-dependent DNA helicase PcrA [Neolewinella antarctica]